MIERKTVNQKIKEFQIQEHITDTLMNVGHSHTRLQRTPLGEKIIIYASRPGLIVGKKGQNIKKLTEDLKNKFGLENPQIEISEVENINLDAQIVAERIAASLERFGSMRFKGVTHKMMAEVMSAGAMGIEIVVSGKVPSTRAKSWRFNKGYLKKCGDIALTGVNIAKTKAKLKSGIIGIKVSIMPPTTILPDSIKILNDEEVEAKQLAKDEKTKQDEEKKSNKKPARRKKKKADTQDTSKKSAKKTDKEGKTNE